LKEEGVERVRDHCSKKKRVRDRRLQYIISSVFCKCSRKEVGVAWIIILKFLLQVGMAATLAGVCQVPLTAVLLLFELTQDYRIVLPLLGAVGLSSWISSALTKSGDERDREKLKIQNSNSSSLPEISSCSSIESSTGNTIAEGVTYLSKLCQVDSSRSVENNNDETAHYVRRTLVLEAMKTRYVTVSMCTPLTKVIDLMLAEKQSCAVIVDTDDTLIGLLTLGDIQEFGKSAKSGSKNPKVQESLIFDVKLF
jgi:CBS domain-containing protein